MMEVTINPASEIVVKASTSVPTMDESNVDEVCGHLARGILHNITGRIKKALRIRQNDDGTLEVKVELAVLQLDEFRQLVGESVSDEGRTARLKR